MVRRVVLLWCHLKVSGAENVPVSGAVIVAPVHRSSFDFLPLYFITDRELYFLVRSEVFSFRALGWLLRRLGCIPIDRSGGSNLNAMRQAEEVLAAGHVLVIFPEGKVCAGAEIVISDGAAFLSARSGAPIIPVGIGGSDAVLGMGMRIPQPAPVRVVVGEAVVSLERGAKRSALTQKSTELRDALTSVYQQSLGLR